MSQCLQQVGVRSQSLGEGGLAFLAWDTPWAPEGLSALWSLLGLPWRACVLRLCIRLLGWELHIADRCSPAPQCALDTELEVMILTWTSTGSSDWASSVSRSSMVIITCPLR